LDILYIYLSITNGRLHLIILDTQTKAVRIDVEYDVHPPSEGFALAKFFTQVVLYYITIGVDVEPGLEFDGIGDIPQRQNEQHAEILVFWFFDVDHVSNR